MSLYYEKCSVCEGRGIAELRWPDTDGLGSPVDKRLCSACFGRGIVPTKDGYELLRFLERMRVIPSDFAVQRKEANSGA